MTTHNLNVPESLNATNHILKATLLLAHIVAPLGIVIVVAEVNVSVVNVPVAAVALLNATLTGSVALGVAPAADSIDIVSAPHVLLVEILRFPIKPAFLSSSIASSTLLGCGKIAYHQESVSVPAFICAVVAAENPPTAAASITAFIASQLA